MRRHLAFAVVAAAIALVACLDGSSPDARAAGPGGIDGTLPQGGGVAAVTWGGGTVDALAAAAAQQGCALTSAWVFVGGQAVGALVGAPDFVNADFLARFPGGDIESGTILVVVCASPVRTPGPVGLVPALGGATFDRPVELVAYPGNRFLVVQQDGVILLMNHDGSGQRTFLDLTGQVRRSGNEEGLLSAALDPAFASNGYVWVYYSVASGARRQRLAQFTVRNDVADPASALTVLEQAEPYSNHNGGAIRFGPDGMLYLGIGDGGSGGDPQGNGQNTSTLLGSIIRIDVRHASASAPYAVPPDSPLVGTSGANEIWAYGLRNPWRMAFDSQTGTLWVGDVGQSAWEEIDVVTRGGNYGWNRLEGTHCYQSGCSAAGTILPVAEYSHAEGCAVVGGVVARDASVPAVDGDYLYSDECSGHLWAIDAASAGTPVRVGQLDGNPTSFATDGNGHVYVVQFGGPVMEVVSK